MSDITDIRVFVYMLHSFIQSINQSA